MTRLEQKEKRRVDILYKGLELFVEKGYSATKTIDIANELNISEGLLFHYFKTKEDLYYELVRLGVEGTNKNIDFANKSPIDIFTEYTKNIFIVIKNDINVARMFVLMPEAQKKGVPTKVRDLALKVNIIEQFIPLIIIGQKDGSIKEGDPKVLSNAFFRSIYAICEGYAIDQSIDLPNPEYIVDILRSR